MKGVAKGAARGAVLAAAGLLLAGSAAGQPAGGANMLTNGDFIDGMNAWQTNQAPPASALPSSSGGELCVGIAAGWLQGIGPAYIDLAFQWAGAADPGAALIYNDYGIAGLGAKSDAVYALIADMVQRGIPVHGVGFQSHLNLSPPPPAAVAANMARYAALGIDVYISEIDVAIAEPPSQADLALQAQVYSEMLLVCLAAENCADFTA